MAGLSLCPFIGFFLCPASFIFIEDFASPSVFCSQVSNGTAMERLASQVRGILEEQRKQLKRFWPCFKGVLSGIKMFAVNTECIPDLKPYLQDMRDMFKERKWRVTQILTQIAERVRETQSPIDHFANILENMVKALNEKTNKELREMLGPKCFRRLSKQCI